MTEVKVYYVAGEPQEEKLLLTYDQWKQLFLEGKWLDRSLVSVEVLDKHSDKGPNRVRFM